MKPKMLELIKEMESLGCKEFTPSDVWEQSQKSNNTKIVDFLENRWKSQSNEDNIKEKALVLSLQKLIMGLEGRTLR